MSHVRTASTANSRKQAMGSRPAQSGAAVAKRLQSELMNLMMSSTPGISAFPRSDDSLLAWQATLEGPVGTPYEGLTYRLSINFGEDFPFQAPMVRFETPCYHPNTTLQGDLCIDILKENWSPSLSIVSILLSLQSLFGEPNNRSPLNVEAADLWDDQVEFRKRVRAHYKPIED